MKKGILIIAGVWLLLNLLSYAIFDSVGAIISTYFCMAIISFARVKLCKLLNI